MIQRKTATIGRVKGTGVLLQKGKRIQRKLRANKVKIKVKKVNLGSVKKATEALQKQVVIQKWGNDCFTCPQKNLQKSNCQLGHVPWPRSILSTECKYDINFTRIQCFSCNINRGGMGAIALKRMQDEGIDTKAMWELSESQKGKTVPISWFLAKQEDYRVMLGLSTPPASTA